MTDDKRILLAILPGTTAQFSPRGTKFAIPLWSYWAEIAQEQAARAEAGAPSDALLDALSLSNTDDNAELVDQREQVIRDEVFGGMIAIAAAAHAIDGFYGSVKPLIKPPSGSARRSRKILEALKLGFKVGRHSSRWQREIDWLFDTRDRMVHHAEEMRPTQITRMTDQTAVVGGPEGFDFSLANARRAADLAVEIIDTCLDHPKSATEEWAAQKRGQRRPSGSEPE
jgi:hypothetical protein